MSTPVPTNPNPFVDPNNALRQFNQYFGDLRKQYGEDAIRQVGFEPKEFQDLQASLRKLQLDPRATPEQHREAYMQARDTLARRLTTPLEATRSYSVVQQPKPAPSPSVGNDGIVTPMPVERPVMNSPTQEQLYSYARAVGRGETGQWDPTRGVFVMTAQPPQPQGGLTQAQQPQPPIMPQPPEREVIGQRSPIPGVHGGDTRIFAPTTQPPMPSAPTQAPLFDRNASLKQLNETFGNLRNTYGEDALRSAGLTPSIFQGFQKTMRELQLNNNSTQDQHTAALQNAYNTMNSFTNNLKPRQLPAPPMALPGGTGYDEQGNMIRSNPDYLSGIGSLLANLGKGMGNAPAQPKFIGQHFTGDAPPPGMKYIETGEGLVPVPINDVYVKPAAGMGLGASIGAPMMGPAMQPQGMTLNNVPRQLTLSNVPVQQPQQLTPVSAPIKQLGMAMGGLMNKYYGGGEC